MGELGVCVLLCREWSLVKHFTGGFYALPLCCRSWGCDYCRPARKREVTRQAAAGHPQIFITITVNTNDGLWPAERARRLVCAWRKFVKVAKKHYKYKSIPYFAVFEATKKKEPHIHILCRVPWIGQKFLSKFMNDEIKAPVVWIEPCTSDRKAANYVAKYIGKAPGKFGTCKRYWQTKDYQDKDNVAIPEVKPRSIGWELVEKPITYIIARARICIHTVTVEGDVWKIETRTPP